jgi:6-phosphogluconolactonase
MLGMGDDGHTASLFPKTHGLHAEDRTVIANFVPQKDVWRMTLTFESINAARHIVIYVIGKGKAEMLKTALAGPYEPDQYPVQKIGTREHRALWIADAAAAEKLLQ